MMKKNSPTTIFVFILMIIPLAGAGVDIHVPSLPSIIHYFGASQAAVQASVTLYLLGYGIGQLVVGTLSDSIGRRPILLVGSLIYVLACIGSVLAPTIHVFLVSRLVQGIAIAGPGIAAKACLSDCFSGKELQKKSSYVVIAWAGGPILAPAIGGYLQHYLGWHACFYFLSIYSLLLFVISYFLLPETKKGREILHIKSIITNYLKVLSHPIFIGSLICSGVAYALMAVFNVMGPFIIQTSLHYSAIQFGHIAFLLGVMWFIGSLLNRMLINYYNVRQILLGGLCCTLFILILVALLLPHIAFDLTSVIIPLVLIYILGGILMPCPFAISLSLFPKLGGIVNALSGLGMMIVTSFMTLVASQLHTQTQMSLIYVYLSMSMIALLAYLTLMRSR